MVAASSAWSPPVVLLVGGVVVGTIVLIARAAGEQRAEVLVPAEVVSDRVSDVQLRPPEFAPLTMSWSIPAEPPSSPMTEALGDFYRAAGISPTDFRCRYLADCSRGEANFTSAKASFVGPEYERGTLPRLLFLSLDPGDGVSDANARTVLAVQTIELCRNVSTLKKTQHWYLTHLFAWEILRQFDRSLEIGHIARFFAHVNTAKCSVNRPGRREAPSRLAANCRGYLRQELAILQPDIIVTQGAKAREAVHSRFPVSGYQEVKVDGATGAHGVVTGLSPSSTLWLQTHHPSAYGVFWRQKSSVWPIYFARVREFFGERTT